jgi:glutathione S-transferase
MIELFKFVPQFGMRDASPFCLKLETYLRLAELAHMKTELMDPSEAPKQKLPFIVDDGETIADSALCISYLKKKYGDPLGDGLTTEQKALGHALRVMLEERTYWVMVYTRWMMSEYQPVTLEAWFGAVPAPMRDEITANVIKEMKAGMLAQGIGRHTQDEIFQLGVADVAAFEGALGGKPYLLGDRPSEYDATGYAFLANICAKPFASPLSDYVESSKPLTDYVARVDKAAFG